MSTRSDGVQPRPRTGVLTESAARRDRCRHDRRDEHGDQHHERPDDAMRENLYRRNVREQPSSRE